MIGIGLAMPTRPKKMPLFLILGNLAIFLIAIVWILIGGLDITFERPNMPYYLILLGVQLFCVVLMLLLIEFRGKAQKFGNRKVVVYLRRWSIIALTIFALQIWSLVPRALLNPFFDLNLMHERFPKDQFGIVFIFAVVTVLVYDVLIWVWGKVNFAYSFEWFITKFSARSAKHKAIRLNFKEMKYDIEWINF